jgi:DNA-binding NarL/FixJ family response regulator
MIEVLLVDDQPAVRRGVRMRLELEPDMAVVGEAGDGEEALRLLQRLSPRVVLMDLQMPKLDGMMATAALRAVAPKAGVVILSLQDDAASRGWAAAAGAAGFVSKREPCDALVAAIRRAATRPDGLEDTRPAGTGPGESPPLGLAAR